MVVSRRGSGSWASPEDLARTPQALSLGWWVLSFVSHFRLSLQLCMTVKLLSSFLSPCRSLLLTQTTHWPRCLCPHPWRTAFSWQPVRPTSSCPWSPTFRPTYSRRASPPPSKSPCAGKWRPPWLPATPLGFAVGTQGIYLGLLDQVTGVSSGPQVDAGVFLSGFRMRSPPGQVRAWFPGAPSPFRR